MADIKQEAQGLLDSIFGGSGTNKTFDTKTALAGLYLWLLFGFLSTSVGCDLQLFMRDNIWFRHFIGLISFFFLFTVLDTNNSAPLYILWFKTFFVYAIFILMTKSKWYFSIPVLLILLIDQNLKIYHDNLIRDKGDAGTISMLEKARYGLSITMYVLIGLGFGSYFMKQKADHPNDFDPVKFVFSYGCHLPPEVSNPVEAAKTLNNVAKL